MQSRWSGGAPHHPGQIIFLHKKACGTQASREPTQSTGQHSWNGASGRRARCCGCRVAHGPRCHLGLNHLRLPAPPRRVASRAGGARASDRSRPSAEGREHSDAVEDGVPAEVTNEGASLPQSNVATAHPRTAAPRNVHRLASTHDLLQKVVSRRMRPLTRTAAARAVWCSRCAPSA